MDTNGKRSSSRPRTSSSPDNYSRKAQAFEALQRRYSPTKPDQDEPLPQLPKQQPLFSPTKPNKANKAARPAPEQELDESLLAAAAVDPTLFNDIANAHLGRPSRIDPVPQTSLSGQQPKPYNPERPAPVSHKSTTADLRGVFSYLESSITHNMLNFSLQAGLQQQDLSSEDSDDADMEEVLQPTSNTSAAQTPSITDPQKSVSSVSHQPQTTQRSHIQETKTQLKPAATRATPHQASLKAQAKLRDATSFNTFAGPSPSPVPPTEGQIDASDEVEVSQQDQGPSLISAALANESDDDEDDFEPVKSSSVQPTEVFDMPIQPMVSKELLPPEGLTLPSTSPPEPSSAPRTARLPSQTTNALSSNSRHTPSPEASPIQLPLLQPEHAPPSLANTVPTEPPESVRLPSLAPMAEADNLDEDSDAVKDWSRSPSPANRGSSPKVKDFAQQPPQSVPQEAPDFVPADFPLAPEGRELDSDDELDAGDLEEAELTANIRAEEGHFSKFLDDLGSRNLAEMRAEVDAEIAQLEQARKVDRRNADEITAQMSKEIMVRLLLCISSSWSALTGSVFRSCSATLAFLLWLRQWKPKLSVLN